jgi:hypothetical protein
MMTKRLVAVAAMAFLVLTSCAKSENAQPAAEQTPAAPADATTSTPEAPPQTAAAAKPCSFVDAAVLTALAGEGATCEDLSDEQAKVGKRDLAEYDLYIKANAAREIADARTFVKVDVPLPGLGDEAYTNKQENTIVIRKGDKFLHVANSGVMPNAPMKWKEGVRYLAEHVLAKL